jgi:predicted acetyltransferase
MTPASAAAVSLSEARVQEAPVIQNLMQLYTHDFSEFWAGTSRGDLGPDGRFGVYPLDDYWRRPHWSAWLIRRNAVLAGFALINDKAHSGMPTHRSVGEFFIVRKHRGQGTGRSAAVALFSRYPGQWEVAVARKNTAACRFWRGVIAGAAQAAGTRELDSHSDRWDGPILRFDWRAGPISGGHF